MIADQTGAHIADRFRQPSPRYSLELPMTTPVDPFNTIRPIIDQLALLLGKSPGAQLQGQQAARINTFLQENEQQLAGNPEAKAAAGRISTELAKPSPNPHRIGADLLHIANATKNVAGIANDAESIAKVVAPLVTSLLL
jgi:hypothetical protein